MGRMVIAGNMRRSAMLAMGKSDDEMFVDLKNYLIFPDRIEYGYCTNNSITIDQNLDEHKHIIKRIKQNGEPGLLFMDNIRRYGRMQNRADSKDFHKIIGGNACAEITLRSYELCNLSEVFWNRIDTLDEFLDVLKYAFLVCKIVSKYYRNQC